MPVPDTDRTVADAIDRVLDAERDAAAAIAAAEAAARAAIDAAREDRRRTLERARARITRLHESAAARLQASLEQLELAAADESCAAAVNRSTTTDVLAVVAERLTGEAPA